MIISHYLEKVLKIWIPFMDNYISPRIAHSIIIQLNLNIQYIREKNTPAKFGEESG